MNSIVEDCGAGGHCATISVTHVNDCAIDVCIFRTRRSVRAVGAAGFYESNRLIFRTLLLDNDVGSKISSVARIGHFSGVVVFHPFPPDADLIPTNTQYLTHQLSRQHCLFVDNRVIGKLTTVGRGFDIAFGMDPSFFHTAIALSIVEWCRFAILRRRTR
jgi:hypothetical protein